MNHKETESLIEETELLFIDTNHHVDQITKEVTLHSPKVKKYMAFHDMSRKGGFWHQGQGYDFGGGGMKLFMEPFMEQNKHIWKIAEWRDNNNGLLILERVGY